MPKPSSIEQSSTEASTAAPEPTAADAIRASLERFVVRKIERSAIKNADYNPRVISDSAKRRLKAGIKKLGILGPIIWNRRTGNIVGGHQRIGIMDKLQGKDAGDYEVTVAEVDLSETEEIEANLLLNNAAAMGEFDIVKLEPLLKIPDLNLEATGWDRADIFRIFGSDKVVLDEALPDAASEDAAEKTAEAVKAVSEQYRKNVEAAHARNNDQFFIVVVFESAADRLDFTEALGLDDNRYQSGKVMRELFLDRDK